MTQIHNTVVVLEPNDGTKPPNLLAEAEVHFVAGAGPLTGLKLVGFSIWKSPQGGTYVTLPARAFGTGQERRYFDYVRAISGDHKETDRLKEFVHDAWRKYRDGRKEA